MKTLMAVMVAVLLVISGLPLGAGAEGAPHLDAKRALVLIDTGAGMGTGFAVSSTLVATACHVIKGAGAIQLHFWAAKVRVSGRQAMCNDRYDIAFVSTAVPDSTVTLQFASDGPAQGDQVWVWGYPLGNTIALEPSLAVGVVSATDTAEGALSLDVSGAPGNSGGPVLNAEGKVVGILIGSWASAGQGSTGFKYAAPAHRAATLLGSLETAALPETQTQPVALEEGIAVRAGEAIGPVRIGMNPAQVQAALGTPPTGRYRNGWMVWETRKISIRFDGGKAFLIDTEDPTHRTPEGIRLGSTDVELIRAFGAPTCASVQQYRGKAYLGWYYGGLFFFLNGSPRKVFAIRVLPSEAVGVVCR